MRALEWNLGSQPGVGGACGLCGHGRSRWRCIRNRRERRSSSSPEWSNGTYDLSLWHGLEHQGSKMPGQAQRGAAWRPRIEIRVCAWLSRRRTKKLALLGPATGPRSASDSAPGRQARRSSLASVLARRAQRNRSLFVIPLTGSFERAMRSRSRRGM